MQREVINLICYYEVSVSALAFSSDQECASLANLITLIYHAWVHFPGETNVSNTQLAGVLSMGSDQMLHKGKPEEQTGLAWTGTLTGALWRRGAPLSRWCFASEGSCW